MFQRAISKPWKSAEYILRKGHWVQMNWIYFLVVMKNAFTSITQKNICEATKLSLSTCKVFLNGESFFVLIRSVSVVPFTEKFRIATLLTIIETTFKSPHSVHFWSNTVCEKLDQGYFS